MGLVDGTYEAFPDQFPEAVKRKGEVLILFNSSGVKGFAPMADLQAGKVAVLRNLPITWISAFIFFIKRLLVRQIKSGGCDDRNLALGKRLGQLAAGTPAVGAVSVGLHEDAVPQFEIGYFSHFYSFLFCNYTADRLILTKLMRLAKFIPLIFSFLVSISSVLGLEDQPEQKVIRLFFTGDVQGNFEPCGCAGGPTGGIARRVGFCNNFMEKHGGFALHVDAGNYFFSPGPDAAQINTYLMESLEKIPMRVMNLGSDDLYWWNDISQSLTPETKIISTNLLPKKAGIKVPDRYTVVEIPADEIGSERPVRIGFVGFVDPRLVKPNSGFRAADPLKSFREIDTELSEKTDFIIVLWDLIRPRGDLKGTDIESLAKENENIYSIITTEKRFVIYDPVQLNSAVILSSIERGRYVGLLSLGLDGSGQVESVRPEFFEMHDQVPEDAYLLSHQRKISQGNH